MSLQVKIRRLAAHVGRTSNGHHGPRLAEGLDRALQIRESGLGDVWPSCMTGAVGRHRVPSSDRDPLLPGRGA